MAKNNCQLKISYEDGLLTARLCGELDHHSAVAVRTLIDSEIKKHSPVKAVLDMKDLDFMDSSGIGLIMGRFALMEKLGGEFAVSNPNGRIVKIFRLAGLDRFVRIEESLQAGKEKPQ